MRGPCEPALRICLRTFISFKTTPVIADLKGKVLSCDAAAWVKKKNNRPASVMFSWRFAICVHVASTQRAPTRSSAPGKREGNPEGEEGGRGERETVLSSSLTQT